MASLIPTEMLKRRFPPHSSINKLLPQGERELLAPSPFRGEKVGMRGVNSFGFHHLIISFVLAVLLAGCGNIGLSTSAPLASDPTAVPPTATVAISPTSSSPQVIIPVSPNLQSTAQPTIQPTVISTQVAQNTVTPTITPVVAPASSPLPIVILTTPTATSLPVTPTKSLPPTPTALPISSAVASPNEPDAQERLFLQLLNDYRKANGQSPLTFEPLLFKSARWLAQDSITKNYVNHTDSLGRNIFSRIRAFGYTGNIVGENIAGGLENAADNLKIWQSDDIHKNNLLNPRYTRAGVGRYFAPNAFNRWFWVLDLG